MASSRRTLQVAERIRELIAMLLVRGEISDPRIKNVTIHSVKVTPDLQLAKVYFSVLGEEAEKNDALQAFSKAAGFIRNQVGKSLQLRYTPELHFYIDDSIEHSIRISALFNKIHEDEAAKMRHDGDESQAPLEK